MVGAWVWASIHGGRGTVAIRIPAGHAPATPPASATPPRRAACPDATIQYLRRAKDIHADSKNGKAYASGLMAAFPECMQPAWADFSGMMLFGAPPE
jgi:hypothetical protein